MTERLQELEAEEAKVNLAELPEDDDLIKKREKYNEDKAAFDKDSKDATTLVKIYDEGKGDFWLFVREAYKYPSLMDRAGFKKRIFKALSTYGFHEGPLCDVLVSRNSVFCIVKLVERITF